MLNNAIRQSINQSDTCYWARVKRPIMSRYGLDQKAYSVLNVEMVLDFVLMVTRLENPDLQKSICSELNEQYRSLLAE